MNMGELSCCHLKVLVVTFLAFGNSTGTSLKFKQPCWMNSFWICNRRWGRWKTPISLILWSYGMQCKYKSTKKIWMQSLYSIRNTAISESNCCWRNQIWGLEQQTVEMHCSLVHLFRKSITATKYRDRRDSCYPWKRVALPTWLWMYLVCRPCSSSLFPSTSCLYPGLITTMISTDFWRNKSASVSILCLQATDWALIRGTYIVQKSVHPFSSVHYSGRIVKDVDLWWNTHTLSLWNITGKQISWSHDRTYCRFKSLISQKFNKLDYFTGGVDWVCDEKTSCETKAVYTALHEPL